MFLVSCKKEDNTPDEDSIMTNANIGGACTLFDEFGNSDSKAGMLVYLEGGVGYYWGETEKDGSFLILNAPYHINYTVVYEKQGYGTYKKYGFNHEYTGNMGFIADVPSLGRKSSTTVSQLNVEVDGDNVEFEVSLGSKGINEERYIRFVFHVIPELSHEVFSHYTSKFTMTNNHHTLILTKEYLQEIGLESGTKYYVQAYGASYFSNSYFDDYNMRLVLPNLGYSDNSPTPKDNFIMP